MMLILDDPERQNEANLTMAGQFATGNSMNFMVRRARDSSVCR